MKPTLVVRHPLGSAMYRRRAVRRMGWKIGIVGALYVVIIAGAMSSNRVSMCSESKYEITRSQIKEYADSAFLLWIQNHPTATCPRWLGDLNEYTNRKGKDITDSWGRDLIMVCGDALPHTPGHFGVWSRGEDGLTDTSDDLRSWE
jgi:hypothetical protein